MKFRKKPVVIEAFCFVGEHELVFPDWFHVALNTNIASYELLNTEDAVIKIKTLEGEMTAQRGDWIIKGVQGEIYPCKPDIFEKTYERVEKDVT